MTKRQRRAFSGVFAAAVLATSSPRTAAQTVKVPVDPGVRGGGQPRVLPCLASPRTKPHSLKMGSPGSLMSR